MIFNKIKNKKNKKKDSFEFSSRLKETDSSDENKEEDDEDT